MKIKIRPDDVSTLQMNDWLAELRDDDGTGPLGHGGSAPSSGAVAPAVPAEPEPTVPAAPVERPVLAEPAVFAAEPAVFAEPAVPAVLAGPAAPTEPAAPAEPAGATVRAVIGDELRMPIMWCEMGSCISWHSDPAALGLGDARARAIDAGWRIDAFGRLACPQCQQTDRGFRVSRPVVLWNRHTAMAMAARIASLRGHWMASGKPVSTDGVLMIQEYAGDAFPSQRHHAGTRTSSSRDEFDLAAVATRPSHLEGRAGRRWLMLAAEMAGLANGSGRPAPNPVPAIRPGLPRIATRALSADAVSVRAARDFTVTTLHRWGMAERSQDIAIVVSELLTNAVRHALPGSGQTRPRRPIRLGLLQPGPCVLCAVADPSKAVPAPQARGSLAETGRGLHIICALSDQWGYAPSDTGKVVWAMFYPGLTVCGRLAQVAVLQ